MYSKFFTVLLSVFIVSSIYAQTTIVKGKADTRPQKVVEGINNDNNAVSLNSLNTQRITEGVGTPILAAKMWNVYGIIGSSITAIDYDPYSEALAIGHRGDRANNPGSGYIWYVVSTDYGQNFFDVGTFTFGGRIWGRYPNLQLSNPTMSTDPFSTDIQPVMAWSGHGNGGAASFQQVNAETDIQLFGGLGQYETVVSEDTSFMHQGATNITNGDVFYALEDWDTGDDQNPLGITLLHSTDAGASWNTIEAFDINDIHGPVVNFGVSGVNGALIDVGPNGLDILFAWEGIDDRGVPHFGYKWSTDGGASFTPTAYLASDDYSYGLPDSTDFLGYTPDAIVAADGPHFIGTYSINGTPNDWVYDVHLDDAGNWTSTKVADLLNVQWSFGIGALNTQNETELAKTPDGEYIFASWIDIPDTASSAPDIFISGRDIDDNAWTTPINISETVDINEKFKSMATYANIVSETDTSITAQLHLFYGIMGVDVNTGTPDSDDTAESEIWYIQDVTITVPKVEGVGIDDVANTVPGDYELHQNYPNPFNPSTTIAFTLKKAAQVNVEVYSVTGEKVVTLVDGHRSAGTHEYTFDASKLASGLYFYKLNAGDFSQTRKMMLLK